MATIRKRGDGYQIRVSVGYDQQGRHLEKSLTWRPAAGLTPRQTEKELAKAALDFETKVQQGGLTGPAGLRLAEFCDQYVQLTADTLAPNTRTFYLRIIEDYIKPGLGHLRLTDIRPVQVQKFILQLSAAGQRKDGKGERLSPATVKRYFTVLKSIMARAYRLGLTDSNPTDAARLDMPTVEEPDIQIFTREEAEAMLGCLRTESLEFQVLVHLAIVTGLRRGELSALSWADVDMEAGTLTVSRSAYKPKGGPVTTKAPKTKGSQRTVALPGYLLELLQQHKRQQALTRLKLGDKWAGADWLFTQWDGRLMNPMTPTRQWTKFLERHGIAHRKFHALRHTSATLLLSGGADIKTVANRLGHSQLKTTDRYVHALRDADRAAADAFQTMFGSQEQSIC